MFTQCAGTEFNTHELYDDKLISYGLKTVCIVSYFQKSKQTYGEHVDKVNYVEMKHVSELAIIGLLLKPFKTWVVPGKPTVILTRTRGGMLGIELARVMDLLPWQGIYVTINAYESNSLHGRY